jgi:serine/threonine protein kinase
MPLTSGTKLGEYQIVAPLGAGGMGQVWRATDDRLGREVAIKVLPDEVAGDAERIRRFGREARSLAALNHPHIAHIYGFAEANGVVFLAMELVEGEDLAQRVARGPLPVPEALAIAR